MKLVCHECRKKFSWEPSDGWPDYCPLCKAFIGEMKSDGVAAPFISLKGAKAADKVYRDMEAGSEVRAQMAASELGIPAHETGIKMTNMKDNIREGEIAAMPIVNDVTKAIDRGNGGFQPRVGLEYSAAVQTGPFANSGAKMQNVIRASHSKLPDTAVTERPALETLSPAYRRRV